MVCALVQGGGYAEYCVAPRRPVPAGAEGLDGAGGGLAAGKLFHRLEQCLRPRPPARRRTLLVQGGTSGIGVTAIQLAAAMGHRVFATAGSDDKARACDALGAERGINYKTADFAAAVKSLTNGRGVDVILDMVAGDYLPREIDCLADDGRIALIALLGGAKATLDMGDVLRRRLTVTGSTLRPRPVGVQGRHRHAVAAARVAA